MAIFKKNNKTVLKTKNSIEITNRDISIIRTDIIKKKYKKFHFLRYISNFIANITNIYDNTI